MLTHHQFFQLPHHKPDRLSVLYVAAVLRTFVFVSFSLFLPILLYKHFLYLGQQMSILTTLAFFFLLTITNVFTLFFSSKIIARFGIRISFLFGQLALLCFFFLMSKNQLIVGAIIFGIASSFWWYPYHIFFVDAGNKRAFGKELGIATSLGILTGIVSPILGGLIVEFGNTGILYLYYAFFIALSLISVSLFKEKSEIREVSMREVLQKMNAEKRDMVSFMGSSAESYVYSVAWPLLLLFVFGDLLKIGAFSSVILLITAACAIGIGILVDTMNKEHIKNWTMFLGVSSWLGKAIFQTPFTLSIFELIYKVTDTSFSVPFNAIAYIKSTKDKELYFAFRETSYRFGELTAIIFFAALTLLHIPVWVTFVFAAIAFLLTSLYRLKS